MMASGPEHYREAVRLLDGSQKVERGSAADMSALAEAQVHATLADVWAHNRATTELISVLNTLLDQIREAREAAS